MDVTKQEARDLLRGAQRATGAVASQSPKEHLHFWGWGLFLVLVIPGFDLFDRTVWGWVAIGVAVTLAATTGLYYLLQTRTVRPTESSPMWVWPALTAWMSGCALLSIGLNNSLTFSYALGGILAALAFVGWGERVRRTS